MMTKEAFRHVEYMIDKECSRNDLSELCDYWGVTIDDYNEFFEIARRGFESENAENSQNNNQDS